MEVAGRHAVVTLPATFERDLVGIAFDIIKTLLKGHFVARLFFALSHFKTAAIFEFNRFLVGGKIAVTYVMWAT